QVNPKLVTAMNGYGIRDTNHPLPAELFSWQSLKTLRGWICLCLGGFLVGFGTRYAGGCTSGHAIMGLSTLQWPSLAATCSFMAGGFLMANLLLPYILKLSL
ncbi:MAG TPA: YeeE/YedE thiosulfate transporter family protein, partial [Sediminibacterium sp.]|nr:YeeE/YedE thiosulfate transporter family protein [Sediminibacterium sp.]